MLSHHPGQDGVVVLEFDITPGGTTENVEIVLACPPETFDRSAVEAVNRWRYAPTQEGKRDQRILLQFKNSKDD